MKKSHKKVPNAWIWRRTQLRKSAIRFYNFLSNISSRIESPKSSRTNEAHLKAALIPKNSWAV